MDKPTPDQVRPLVNRAVELAGSQAKLGALAGRSQHAIWYAAKHGRVSPEMARGIHDATDGQVAKWELRPDIFDAPGEAA